MALGKFFSSFGLASACSPQLNSSRQSFVRDMIQHNSYAMDEVIELLKGKLRMWLHIRPSIPMVIVIPEVK